MSQIPDHGINDPDLRGDAQADKSCEPPCAEALMAGTLALMTAHAPPCCTQHRQQVAARVASNLVLLSQHPLMSPGFHAVAWKLHAQWVLQTQAGQGGQAEAAGRADDAPKPDHSRALWHTTPEVIQ